MLEVFPSERGNDSGKYSQNASVDYGDALKYMQLNSHILQCKRLSTIDLETF